MRGSHRVFLAFLVARFVFGLAFLVSVVQRWAVPWYLPLEHRWLLARRVPGVAIDWYGRSSVSLASGALAGLCAYALAGVPSVGAFFARRGVAAGIAQLGALMLVSDVAWYALTLFTRDGTPAPLPAWYCPR